MPSAITILAIDPGTRDLGYAIVRAQGRPDRAARIRVLAYDHIRAAPKRGRPPRPPRKSPFAYVDRIDQILPLIPLSPRPDLVIIEMPQSFASARGRAALRSGSVQKLTFCVASIRQALRPIPCTLVHPSKWKGNVPKHITLARLQRRFPALSRSLANANHNAVDALGIAVYAADRLAPSRPSTAPPPPPPPSYRP